MRKIPPSELVINGDGSVFHLHLLPGQVAETVVLVGDPGRVDVVASYFDVIESRSANREFVSTTGIYNGKRITVLSTGIGTDNIDIVVTELDALFNVDFETRTEKKQKTTLTLLRLGTSGALQPDVKIGDLVFARTSLGFDGLLNFYKGRDEVCDLAMEQAFMEHTQWGRLLTKPYFVNADEDLRKLFADSTIDGITVSAPGFYGPQGRWVRLEPADPDLNSKIESFVYNGRKITNFEMESSALAGLSRLMGHRAATICAIIAQRVDKGMNTDYKPFVDKMITMSLDKLAAVRD